MNKKLFKIILSIIIIVIVTLIIIKKVPKIELKINLPIEEQIKLTKMVSEYSKDEISNDINTIYERYDIVTFGKYYQNENRDKKTNIEWYVLDKNDDYALLLSKYVLDTSKMSESEEECQWSETILRKWLNNEFYDIAFNQEEKEKIIECELENFNIPLSLHKKQNKTKDKVFVLSFEELQTYFNYDSDNGSKKISTTATEYAFSKNELFNLNSKEKEEEKKEYAKALNIPISALSQKTTTYWTRTFKDNKCVVVDFTGNTTGKFDKKSNLNKPNGVRPAIFIKLNNIATRSIITYNMFNENENLKEPSEEYDC